MVMLQHNLTGQLKIQNALLFATKDNVVLVWFSQQLVHFLITAASLVKTLHVSFTLNNTKFLAIRATWAAMAAGSIKT
jgi:hypothetical protein